MTDDDKEIYKELLVKHKQFVFQNKKYTAYCIMDCEKCAIYKYKDHIDTNICPSLEVGKNIEHEIISAIKLDYPEYFI